MFAKKEEKIVGFLLLMSALALLGAYVSQYLFGFRPCILCLYQRIPFFAILFFGAIFFVSKNKNLRAIFLSMMFAALLFNGFLALYHVGVEQGIFLMTEACVNGINSSVESLEELRESLLGQPLTSCDKPEFVIFGISMAMMNAAFCFGLFGLGLWCKFGACKKS